MIPTSFTLVNRRYEVEELSESLADDLGRHGDFCREDGVIRVEMVDVIDAREHTFFHELVHALLEASSRPSLSKKEAFVDSLAAVLHQYMQTKKGRLSPKK